MKTYNRILFHCQCCGQVVHADPDVPVPVCCGHEMTRAAEETVWIVEQCELPRFDCFSGGHPLPAVVFPVPR